MHIVELVVLPLSMVCTVTAWAYMLWLALVPGATYGVALGLLLLTATTVVCTVLISSLRLPYSLHLLGLFALISLSFSPLGQGETLRQIILSLTWLGSIVFGSTVAGTSPIYRALVAEGGNKDVLAERSFEIRTEWEIYALRHSELRRARSLVLGPISLVTALAVWLIAGGIGLDTHEQRDLPFAVAGAILLSSIVIHSGLLTLLHRKLQWEREEAVHFDTEFSRPWPRTVLLCTLLPVGAAWLLPADVSPLYSIDWNAIMTDLTVRLFSQVRPDRTRLDVLQPQFGDTGGTAVAAFTPGGGLELLPLLHGLLFFGIFVYGVWKLLQLFMLADRERRHGLLAIIGFVVKLPLLLLQHLGRKLFGWVVRPAEKGIEDSIYTMTQGGTVNGPKKQSIRNHTVRRLFVLLLQWAKEQGAPRAKTQTAAEFARTLASRYPAVANDIAYVVDVYQSVRYAPADHATSSVEQVRASYERIVEAGTGQSRGMGIPRHSVSP